jgi:serine/threonine protein kinase/sugar lactone lactonase YvrE
LTLNPGTRIGEFEITGHIGSGGMGEVYRARDTKLGREVAIKVLPEALSRDPTRLARFEREARLLASLNHPNIATVYGIVHDGEADGMVRALVMELVAGDTLAERLLTLPRGRGLPLDETLRIAQQIVDALDAAHERGIVHRDLKPPNIKVRPDGTAKVLDFGLAKAEGTPVGASAVDTETIAIPATREGVILGSPGYMSPEQARGLPVDSRVDIWAFGCVLFEMVSGRAPFEESTALDLIAASLTREPDWAALPADLPDSLRRLLRRCLQREPRRRLRDIADASFDLEDAMRTETSGAARANPAPRAVSFKRLTDRFGLNQSPAISPDGRMIAFVAPAGGERHIWVRMLTGGAPLQITSDTGDHEQPRWTADGGAIVYFAGPTTAGESGTLMEVSALGGTPRPLASSLHGGDVSHDGRRIATFQMLDGTPHLVTISRQDGTVDRVCAAPRGGQCRWPRWSVDDREIAFHSRTIHQFDEQLYVVPANGGNPRLIARASAFRGLSWLPDGSGLLYSSSTGSTILYPPTHNLRRVSKDGEDDRAVTFGDLSYVEPDMDKSGRIVVARIWSQSDIWKFPVTGAPVDNTRAAVRITRQSGQVRTPSVSPDGTEVAYLSDNGGHANIWVARTDGAGMARQITFEHDDAVTVGLPVWSPVDDRIAFVAGRAQPGVWIVRSDGRGLQQLVPNAVAPCWSPDGTWLYYSTPPTDSGEWHVHKIPSRGGPAVVVRNDGNSCTPVLGASALYYAAQVNVGGGVEEWEIRRASPEDGPWEPVARVAGSHLPISSLFIDTVLSPDGRWLALPLLQGDTCSIGIAPVTGGAFEPAIDFGDRPTVIARQVSWSPDGSIYAAVAEINEDIVLLDGLI